MQVSLGFPNRELSALRDRLSRSQELLAYKASARAMAHGVRPWLTLVLALLAALARGTSEHQAREHARRKVEREENLRLADDFRQADTNGDEFLSRGEVVHWELGRQMGYTRAGIQPHAIDAATLQWQADQATAWGRGDAFAGAAAACCST